MKVLDFLGPVTDHRSPRIAALLWAALAGLLFLVSVGLQLRASYARWIEFDVSLQPTPLSVESHEYDYYLPTEGYLPIPDTAVPLGVGLILQAVGVVSLLLCLLTARLAAGRINLATQMMLGLFVAAGYALAGYQSLRSGLDGLPHNLLALPVPGSVIMYGFAALGVLCFLSGRVFPAAGFTWFFLIGSTPIGFLISTLFITPLLTFYVSHDTAPGTETFVAFSSALAALSMLGALLTLGRTRRLARRVPRSNGDHPTSRRAGNWVSRNSAPGT